MAVLAAYELGPDGSTFDHDAEIIFTLPDPDPNRRFAIVTSSGTGGVDVVDVVDEIEVDYQASQVVISGRIAHFATVPLLRYPVDVGSARFG